MLLYFYLLFKKTLTLNKMAYLYLLLGWLKFKLMILELIDPEEK